jgi:transcriptional regulator with XRE-family HTH domain
VSQVERGIKNVSLTNILKLSRALGCPVSELMDEAEKAGL